MLGVGRRKARQSECVPQALRKFDILRNSQAVMISRYVVSHADKNIETADHSFSYSAGSRHAAQHTDQA